MCTYYNMFSLYDTILNYPNIYNMYEILYVFKTIYHRANINIFLAKFYILGYRKFSKSSSVICKKGIFNFCYDYNDLPIILQYLIFFLNACLNKNEKNL